MKKRIGIAIAALAISGQAFAGPSAGTTSTSLVLTLSERVDAALSASIESNFSLPEVAQGAPAYSITSTTGAAEFLITGEPGYTVTMSVPSTVQLTGTYNGNDIMNITGVATATAASPTVPATSITLDGTTGTASAWIIGTRETITSTYPRDIYAGTVTVSLAYQ
jgi:hypothetical protein